MSKRAISALENLGFTTYEARAYLGLLQENPISGYRLSQRTGIPRSRIYETLARLINQGYAIKYQAEPVVYAPLGFSELQTHLKEQFDDKLSTLESEVERITTTDTTETLWTLYGREAIMSRMQSMITSAQKSIYLVAWAETLQPLHPLLQTAVNQTIRVITISCGHTDPMPGIHYRHAFEENIVNVDIGTINLVVDGKAVLVGTTLPANSCQAFWSHNPNLIAIIEEYIRHEVYLHKIIDRLGSSEAETLRQTVAAGLQEIPYE